MNRRSFISTTSVGVAGLVLAPPFAAARTLSAGYGGQAAQAPPVTRFEELRRGVGMFIGSGGTIGYLVNGDGAIAIDSQFMNTATICAEGLKQRAPKGIAMLLNTHHHGDHTGGNKAYGVSKIVAHANCLKSHKAVTEEAKTVDQQAYATATFTDTWTEKFGDETIEGRYYGAGHTGGDAVYHFQRANVMHMGDLLFNRAHPNIDRPQGANVANWIKVLEAVNNRASNDTIFIAGHAKDNVVRNTKTEVMHFRNYLTAVLEHARAGAKAGQSKEEVQALPVLKGFEDNVSPNARLTLAFVLGTCYDEVTGK
ncbi:MAG: MBL fold metallo-hydrolase [Acidobacteriota bacterium]|nr:MBL fold metallo-hydrolase [Acidobacteriota bacterium]